MGIKLGPAIVVALIAVGGVGALIYTRNFDSPK
jgi:hypothetical protein